MEHVRHRSAVRHPVQGSASDGACSNDDQEKYPDFDQRKNVIELDTTSSGEGVDEAGKGSDANSNATDLSRGKGLHGLVWMNSL